MKKATINSAAIVAVALTVLVSGCGNVKSAATTSAAAPTTQAPAAGATSAGPTPPPASTAAVTPTPSATPSTMPASLGDPPDIGYVVRILLADGNFAPKVVTIPAGTRVIWWTTEHWVDQTLKTEDGNVLGTPFLFQPLEYIFTTPGTYNYYDDFSPWVKGTVIVY